MRTSLVVAVAAALFGAAACARSSSVAPSPVGTHDASPAAAVQGGLSTLQVSSQAGMQSGVTLADVLAGFTLTSNNYVGQSVTIPGRGAFNRLKFNWYNAAHHPVAFGTLYLLDREYLGTPSALGETTPGVIARSEAIVDGQYVFAPGVVVRAGEQYWVYTDAQGAFVTGFSVSTYAGGSMYITGMPNLAFHLIPSGIDANFRLQARQ